MYLKSLKYGIFQWIVDKLKFFFLQKCDKLEEEVEGRFCYCKSFVRISKIVRYLLFDEFFNMNQYVVLIC